MTDNATPRLVLTKAMDETSIRQFYQAIVGRELTPEELEELRAECERVGLPEKVSSTPHAQRP
jgi:hypothetical protein